MTQRQVDDEPSQLLTTAEVAAAWRVSRRTVERYAATGRLAHVQLPSGVRRFRRSDIEAVATPRVGAQSVPA